MDVSDTLGVRLKCPKCSELSFAYQDFVSLFDKLNFLMSRIDVNTDNRDVNRRQIADVSRWAREYRAYLMMSLQHHGHDDNTFEVCPGHEINHAFRLFYVDFSKLLDLLARLHCNMGDFERASLLGQQNVTLLEKIYSSSSSDLVGQKVQFDIEVANEHFKLAEIQCNCQKWSQALASVNRAIEIGDKLYSADNSLLAEFRSFRQNILSVLNHRN